MIQTGGTATFNAGLAVGDDDSTDPGETDNATGLYEISAGTLTTNLAGDALRLGSAGNGTLRVVGQDGVINVNGNLTSSNTSDGAGNLAYKFESGESLSTVNVTGTATFAFNSGLAIDSSAIPTPASGTTYDLVSAADVTDNGLLLTDWGWTHQVVTGGAGELLQAVKTTPQYWDTDGTTPGAGGAAPSGAWNGSAANFSTDSTGSSATGATTGVLDDVVFAAGSDGTGSYTVTVSGTQTAHAVQFARGDVLLSGGTLAVGHFDAVSGATGTVSSNVTGDAFGRVIKSGAGTITLASANSYGGGTTVNGGTLVVANADALGGGALAINDATAQAQVGLPKAIKLAGLTTTGSGKLDLTDNKLITNDAARHRDRRRLQRRAGTRAVRPHRRKLDRPGLDQLVRGGRPAGQRDDFDRRRHRRRFVRRWRPIRTPPTCSPVRPSTAPAPSPCTPMAAMPTSTASSPVTTTRRSTSRSRSRARMAGTTVTSTTTASSAPTITPSSTSTSSPRARRSRPAGRPASAA